MFVRSSISFFRSVRYLSLLLSLVFVKHDLQGVTKALRPPLQFQASMISQMYFTLFDRAHRALQNCLYQKNFKSSF